MATELTVAGIALSEHTDQDLVDRHRYGDPAAFEEVYRRFESMVYNLALRLSGDPEEASDLSQEAFLRIYRHLAKFKGRSTLKTWIYRVTLNHCRSRLGRRKPSQQFAEGAEERMEDPRRSPEERALADDASRLVAEALAQIKPVFREAVVLRDLEGLAYGEIAEVLGVRIGTVRSRIARGRDQLRLALEERLPRSEEPAAAGAPAAGAPAATGRRAP